MPLFLQVGVNVVNGRIQPATPIDLGFNGGGGNLSCEVFAADDGYVYLAGPDTVRYAVNPDGSLGGGGSNIYATSFEIFAADGFVYASHNSSLQILDAGQPNRNRHL